MVIYKAIATRITRAQPGIMPTQAWINKTGASICHRFKHRL